MTGLSTGAAAAQDRVAELESRLRRIGAEVQAAGLLPELGTAGIRYDAVTGLSARQIDILWRVAGGQRVQTIAEELYLSPSTVRNHLTAIFKKFGVHSQADLIRQLLRSTA